MSVIKFLRDWTDLFNWSTDENPTTQQDYQEAVKNWIETEKNIVDTLLWQPTTEYVVDNVVKTPSLPSQYYLICTTAGISGATEPDYTGVSPNDEITDGTVVWRVQKNTRLGTILSASGTSTTAGSSVTLCSITNHPAGVWLITSHVRLSTNVDGVYQNTITVTNHGSQVTRGNGNSGGGITNVRIVELAENDTINLVSYIPAGTSTTINGTVDMVQLA